MATDHRSIMVYVFSCTFPNPSTTWQDDPTALKSAIKTAMTSVANMTYSTIKISNVRNSSRKELEIHLDNVKSSGSNNLTSAQVDSLRLAIKAELDLVANFTYQTVDVVNNLFHEDKTSGWVGTT